MSKVQYASLEEAVWGGRVHTGGPGWVRVFTRFRSAWPTGWIRRRFAGGLWSSLVALLAVMEAQGAPVDGEFAGAGSRSPIYRCGPAHQRVYTQYPCAADERGEVSTRGSMAQEPSGEDQAQAYERVRRVWARESAPSRGGRSQAARRAAQGLQVVPVAPVSVGPAAGADVRAKSHPVAPRPKPRRKAQRVGPEDPQKIFVARVPKAHAAGHAER